MEKSWSVQKLHPTNKANVNLSHASARPNFVDSFRVQFAVSCKQTYEMISSLRCM